MSNPTPASDQARFQPASGGCLEIFDPPMCCSSGVCGPTVDKTLVDVAEMVEALRERGVDVRRDQMSAQPQAFMKNAQVYQFGR